MSQVPGVGRVHIQLDGLMIGRFLKDEKGKPFCEIGVLSQAKGHKFTVCYEVVRSDGVTGKNVDIPDGCTWELGIEGAEPNIEPFDSGTKPDRRNPPSEATSPLLRKDFRWVLDLEGADFPEHPKKVVSRPELLNPVIRIKNGVVFNNALTKTPLTRLLNGGPPEEFGAVSDELGIDIDPKPGDDIVLKVDKGEDIFRIPVTGSEVVHIFINNVPPTPPGGDHFHFQMYYDALEVPPAQRYDFRVKATEPAGDHGHDHSGHTENDAGGDGSHHTHNADSGGTTDNPEPAAKSEFKCGGGSAGSGAPLCGVVFVGS